MELDGPRDEDFLGLDDLGVREAALQGADGLAGFVIVEADALGAELRIDDVDLVALADRLVRTLGLAGAAVDAVFRDVRCHGECRPPAVRYLEAELHGVKLRSGACSALAPPPRRARRSARIVRRKWGLGAEGAKRPGAPKLEFRNSESAARTSCGRIDALVPNSCAARLGGTTFRAAHGPI